MPRVADRPFPTIGGERPAASPWPVELFIGVARQPVVNYVYDDYTAAYDSPSAAFTYDDRTLWPYDRFDLFCKFHGLTITTGGADPDGRVDAGHVEMTLDNRDGSLSQYDAQGRLVDWVPGSPLDIWAHVGDTPAVPYVPGYLTPTVGTVTTPDPGPLPNQCTFVFKVRGPGTGNGVVAAQYEASGQFSWSLTRIPPSGNLFANVSPTGTATGQQSANMPSQAVTAADEFLACSFNFNDGAGNRRYQPHTSPDGIAWTPRTVSTAATIAPFDSNSIMRVGARSGGATERFDGRIYWVELRTGLDPAAGAVVWRFDADDYPGTGTTYTDPRGRTWTLTNAAAITPKVSAVPAVPRLYWLFSGTITAWRERQDGTVDAEAFDAFSILNEAVAEWDPGVFGDTPAQRLGAICAAHAYPGPTRFATGAVTLHSYLSTASPLEEMQHVALSDGGVVMVDADGTLVYVDRQWVTGRADQVDVPTFSDNNCDAPLHVWDAEQTTDDTTIVNRVTLTSLADVTVTAANVASADLYGPQSIVRSGDQWVDADDGQALADYLVIRRGDAYLRLEPFVLHLADPNQPGLWPAGIDRRIGDVVTWVHDQPTTTGTALVVIDVVVQSIAHEITPESWVTTIGTTRTVGTTVAPRYDRTPFQYDQVDARNIYAL